jgi:hypothetical protein
VLGGAVCCLALVCAFFVQSAERGREEGDAMSVALSHR